MRKILYYPIIKIMDNPQNYYDLSLGIAILLIGIVCGVIISNKIITFFIDDNELHFILLFIYLMIITTLILFIQHILDKVIVNKKILHALNNLIGLLIGTSSLFLVPSLHNFIKKL